MPEIGEIVIGRTTFRAEKQWAKLPEGIRFGDVGGVAVDAAGRIHVFNRGPHPVIVLEQDGSFASGWGEGLFTNPHAIDIAADGHVYCTDDGDHTVRKFTADGRLVMTIGLPGTPGPRLSGVPFNRCTHTAVGRHGDIFVSDGYGNAHIHRFRPDGTYVETYGGFGPKPGQFNIPHNIASDGDGLLYVADRENHRVQVLDEAGRVQSIWAGLHRPCALCRTRGGDIVIGEAAAHKSAAEVDPQTEGLRISQWSATGEPVGASGRARPARTFSGLIAPHGMAVDATGAIYVGEVTTAAWRIYFPGEPPPDDILPLRKFVPITPTGEASAAASGELS